MDRIGARAAAAAAGPAAPRRRGRGAYPAPRADAAVRAEVTAVTRPSPSGGTRHTATLLHARQAPRRTLAVLYASQPAAHPCPWTIWSMHDV